MAGNAHENLKTKQYLGSSERFLQYMVMNCKALHSAANNQGISPINKPPSLTRIERQSTCSFKDAQKVVQKATDCSISDIVSYIILPKPCAECKLALLSDLQQKCQRIPDLFEEVIASGSLVQYAEKLLCSYNRAAEYSLSCTTTEQDLPLLTALLQFLMSVTDMTVHTIRELLLYQSDFLMQLVHAVLRCSHNLVTTLSKFEKCTTGSLSAMTRSEVDENFESHFGINISSIDLKLEGTLLDPAEKQAPNKEIFGAPQKVVGDIEIPQKNGEVCEMVFNDVIMKYTLLPNCAFVYTNSSCTEQLLYMSSLLKAEIVAAQRENLNDLNIGAVYGLYSADVTFEGAPSLNTECIRGQLLTKVSEKAMIWAMDFGLFGFTSASNLYLISSQELLIMPPLAKLCVLKGLVQEAEEEFLHVALKLLRAALETNVHIGKSMLLSEDEEKLFLLVKHSKAQIRIALLDLLECLARNDRDVATFIEEKGFHKAVLGKLEYYAHVYAADLCKSKTDMGTEIMYMISILQGVMEEKKRTRILDETERVIRVVSMFNKTTYCWKDSITSFLSFLEKETAKKQITRNCYSRKGRGHKKGQKRPQGRKMENKDEVPQTKLLYTAEQNIHPTLETEGMKNFAMSKEYNKSYGWGGRQRNEWCMENYKDYDSNEGKFDEYCINIQKSDSRMVNNVRPDQPLLTHFQQRVITNNTEKPASSVYTDIEDNIEQVFVSPGQAENDTVDLSAKKGLDYVTRGSTASVHPNETHAFITEKNLNELKQVDLAQVICGLLNNNTEGFVYFGITLKSIIEGIIVKHSDKDTFRNGIDRIMHGCLIPGLRVNSYDIIFTPVFCKEETTRDLRNHKLYIIELRVHPMVHEVYAVYHGRKCFIRRGTETIEYAVMQKVYDMMGAEERQIEEYMQNLDISTKRNLAELTALVEKCLSQSQV